MTELTEIDGVGPSYAETLADNGYDSAEAVADADPDAVDGLIGNVSGDTLVENARDVSAEDTGGDDADDAGDDAEDAGGGDDEQRTLTIDADFTDVQENYLIRALVEQETRARRTNNGDQVGIINDAIDEVKSGQPYELTLDQAGQAYTGINQLEQDLRADRSINRFVSDVRDVKQVFQQARNDNWPEE